jgi:hypothetical protein
MTKTVYMFHGTRFQMNGREENLCINESQEITLDEQHISVLFLHLPYVATGHDMKPWEKEHMLRIIYNCHMAVPRCTTKLR